MRLAGLGLLLASCAAGGNADAGSGLTTYVATLTGDKTVPPSGSTGTGSLTATWDGNTLTVMGTFTGLREAATTAHLHNALPTETSTVIDELTVTQSAPGHGSFSGSSTSIGQSYLDKGTLYVDVHTVTPHGNELRGHLEKKP